MSNIRDLFPGSQNQPPVEQPATPAGIVSELVMVSSLQEAHDYAEAEKHRPRTLVAVDHVSAGKLEKAAIEWRQTPYFVFMRCLNRLMLDEAFEMPGEDMAGDLPNKARSFQLKAGFFQAVSEFSSQHRTTPDTLAHMAVTNYLVIPPAPDPTNPFKLRRHLRVV